MGVPVEVAAALLRLPRSGAASLDVDDAAPRTAPDGEAPDGDAAVTDEEEAAQCLRAGNEAYRQGQFADAIQSYTQGLQEHPRDPSLLLGNRCAAFCSLSRWLRQIPAAQSEQQALSGLDPISLAQLAVKDAEKAVAGRGAAWPKAHGRLAGAHMVLEHYDAARAALAAGLALHPNDQLLLAMHDALESAIFSDEVVGREAAKAARRQQDEDEAEAAGRPAAGARPPPRQVSRGDELDCVLCLKLLYQPATTPCGHTFCRACLARALDHSSKCPVCRSTLFMSARSYPISVTLQALVERSFPEEYAERAAEMEALTSAGPQKLPMFVMDVVLPGQKVKLNIFEPRYRLMVRRVMESDRHMGMVGYDAATQLPADVACEVEICECVPLPDGRLYLEVEGRRRCQVVNYSELDGYRVGHVTWLEDTSPVEGSPAAAEVLAAEAVERLQALGQRAQEGGRRGLQLSGMPPTSKPEAFSFWVANLLQMATEERLLLLRMQDTLEYQWGRRRRRGRPGARPAPPCTAP
eukprot:SM000211S06649  [mRNA]  locus=s211:151531:156544:- [translate_table: standard]